jgi:hypothetical protein
MCKLKKFLSILAIIFNLIFVIEVGYFCWFIGVNSEEYSSIELIVTVFINASIVVFAAVAIVGVVKSNHQMLGVWMVYAVVELARSATVVYDSWNDDEFEANVKEKLCIVFDAGAQAMAIFVVSLLFEIVRIQEKTKSSISTIGRSIELSRRSHEKLKPPEIACST